MNHQNFIPDQFQQFSHNNHAPITVLIQLKLRYFQTLFLFYTYILPHKRDIICHSNFIFIMTFCVTFLGYYVNTKTVTVQPGAVLLRLTASLRMQIAVSHAQFTLSYVLAQRCVQGLPELLLKTQQFKGGFIMFYSMLNLADHLCGSSAGKDLNPAKNKDRIVELVLNDQTIHSLKELRENFDAEEL